MTDHKFTDDDVIKALEYSVEHNERKNASCDGCPLEKVFPYCNRECSEDTLEVMCLALINRQKAEIERLNAVHADMTESLRLAAEANKDMSVELNAMRGAANSYKMHYEETERKYKIAVAEREANVDGFVETLEKQRTETERLYIALEENQKATRFWKDKTKTARAEAIKEFAKRLTSKLNCIPQHRFMLAEVLWDIDTLVKEMTEGK